MGLIDAAEVRRLARLARIELAPGEDEQLAAGLRPVMDRLAALRAVEAAPMPDEEADPGAGDLALREDVPDADALVVPPRKLAPEWRDGMFLVPHPPGLAPRE